MSERRYVHCAGVKLDGTLLQLLGCGERPRTMRDAMIHVVDVMMTFSIAVSDVKPEVGKRCRVVSAIQRRGTFISRSRC